MNEFTILIFGGLLGVLQAIALALVGWNLKQSVFNGREIVRVSTEIMNIRSELVMRVQVAEREHSEFVRRAEIDPKISALTTEIKRLGESITELSAELRRERDARLRREGQEERG